MGRGKDWSMSDLNYLKDNFLNMSHNDIAKKLNRTRSAVQLKASRMGLQKPDKYFYDIDFFENINTEEKAYWLGFIYADGYTQNKSELAIQLGIKDIEHLRKFNKSIHGNIDVSIFTSTCSFNDKPRIMCGIRLYKNKIIKDIQNYGVIPNKTFIIQFPQISSEYILPFIRGYFDGDGSLMKYQYNKNVLPVHRCKITCGSIIFLEQIREILYNTYNINSYIVSSRNIYDLHICGMTNAYEFCALIYDNANIYLDRKYKLYHHITSTCDIKNRIKNNKNKNRNKKKA